MSAMIFLTSALLGATVFDHTFDRANESYKDENYTEAISLYEQLITEGVVDTVVFYNLGNAYFRSNRLGPAIANYERALQIDPNFNSARQNLRLCIEQTPRSAGRPLPPDWEQSLLFWHYGLSIRASAIAAAVTWLLAWGLLGLRLVRPVPYTRAAAIAALVFAALFAASAWSKSNPRPMAVASDEEVPVYFDRDEGSTLHFQLLVGDRVTGEESDAGWILIEAPSGERGWAQRNGFAMVGPPYERPPG